MSYHNTGRADRPRESMTREDIEQDSIIREQLPRL